MSLSSLPEHLLNRDQQPSQLTLERYLLGELSSAEEEQLEKLMQASPELLDQVKQLKRSNIDIRHRFPPPAALLQRSTESAQVSRWVMWSRYVILAVLITAMGLSIRMVNRWSEDQESTQLRSMYSQNRQHGDTRLKGQGSHWEVYLDPSMLGKTQKSTKLESQATVYPGQRIGFRVYPGDKRFYMVVGRENSGVWYLGAPHAANPIDNVQARELPVTKEVKGYVDLDISLVLDKVLGREEFYLLLCPTPVRYRDARSELQSKMESPTHKGLKTIDLTSGCQVTYLPLNKEKRP